MNPRHDIGWCRRCLAWSLNGLAIILMIAWVVGAIVSDRWWWSQWLSWMTPAALVGSGFLLTVGQACMHRRWWILGPVVAAAGSILFVVPRMGWSFSAQKHGLRLMQWTSGPILGDATPYAEFIAREDPDVLIMHGGLRIGRAESFHTWSQKRQLAMRGPFVFASRLPIHRLQTVAWADNIMLVNLECVRPNGQLLRVLAVDLPSDPARSKSEILRKTHQLLSRLETPPDVILGDFNMTQNSRVLRSFLPGWKLGWPFAGRGWGGTWPRWLPAYRLDHVLIPDHTQPLPLITTHDPGVGTHRAQIITLPSRTVN